MESIHCFDLDGVYQNSYSSCEEASKSTRTPMDEIRSSLRRNGGLSGKYYWSFQSRKTPRSGKLVRSIDSTGAIQVHKSIKKAAEYHSVSRVVLGKKLRGSSSVLYHGIRFKSLKERESPMLLPQNNTLPSLDEAADVLSSLSRYLREIPKTLEIREPLGPDTTTCELESSTSLCERTNLQSLTEDPLDIPTIPLMSEMEDAESEEETEEEEPFSVWLDSPIGSDVD